MTALDTNGISISSLDPRSRQDSDSNPKKPYPSGKRNIAFLGNPPFSTMGNTSYNFGELKSASYVSLPECKPPKKITCFSPKVRVCVFLTSMPEMQRN